MCMSNKLPGGADMAPPKPHFGLSLHSNLEVQLFLKELESQVLGILLGQVWKHASGPRMPPTLP